MRLVAITQSSGSSTCNCAAMGVSCGVITPDSCACTFENYCPSACNYAKCPTGSNIVLTFTPGCSVPSITGLVGTWMNDDGVCATLTQVSSDRLSVTGPTWWPLPALMSATNLTYDPHPTLRSAVCVINLVPVGFTQTNFNMTCTLVDSGMTYVYPGAMYHGQALGSGGEAVGTSASSYYTTFMVQQALSRLCYASVILLFLFS
jgi:hypothetical protein